MKIVYKTGNLLTASGSIILHGCNAQGVMGSGVAKAIREKFPHAYDVYRTKYVAEGLDMGEVLFVPCENTIVANAITQKFYGRDGRQYVDYDSINNAMGLVNEYALKNDLQHVAMPLIGAGYGGGSWNIISEIIENRLTHTIPMVYTLDGTIPSN